MRAVVTLCDPHNCFGVTQKEGIQPSASTMVAYCGRVLKKKKRKTGENCRLPSYWHLAELSSVCQPLERLCG